MLLICNERVFGTWKQLGNEEKKNGKKEENISTGPGHNSTKNNPGGLTWIRCGDLQCAFNNDMLNFFFFRLNIKQPQCHRGHRAQRPTLSGSNGFNLRHASNHRVLLGGESKQWLWVLTTYWERPGQASVETLLLIEMWNSFVWGCTLNRFSR